MKIAMLMSVLTGSLLFLTGCSTVTEVETGKEFSAISTEEDVELEKIGKQYSEDVLQAIKNVDYELLAKHIMPEYLKNVSEEDFRKSCENYRKSSGEQINQTYLGFLRGGPMVREYIWKTEFSKQIKDKEGNERTYVYDKLFSIAVAKSGDQYYVLGFRFP
jgi:hypothetical protein